MREHRLRDVQGYKLPRAVGGGPPSLVAPNRLQRQFTLESPDKASVTDITYVCTWHCWLYLAVVMDLHSRRIVGWSMKPSLARELAWMRSSWRCGDDGRRRASSSTQIRGRNTAATTSSGSVELITPSPA